MKIYSIGTATLDVFFIINNLNMLKKLKEKNDVDKCLVDIGGGGLNFAYTFQKLGLDSTAVIKLGNDFIGKFIKKIIEEKKIKTHIITTKGNSSLSFIFLSKTGKKYIFTHRANEIFKAKDIPFIYNKSYYISTGKTPVNEWLKIISVLKQKNNFIGINPSKYFLISLKQKKNKFPLVDFLNINFYEAQLIMGYKSSYPDKIYFLRKLKEKLDFLNYILVTDGNNGSWLLKDKIYHCEAYKKMKVLDTTGAGDCFGSTFFGLLIKNNFKDSENELKEYLKYATINTAYNLSKIGAQTGILSWIELKKYKNENLKIKIFKL
ncbi:MAG: ribokinase [Candidatus Parcubacteria bacterium]|nr:MAG: ribokinase [Candidatus Parcubacteria bacterium]